MKCVPYTIHTTPHTNFSLFSVIISSQKVIVVELVVVLLDRALDIGRVEPGHMVLHRPRDEKSGVGHRLRSDADVPLLDEGDGLAHCLAHLEPDHYLWDGTGWGGWGFGW